MGLHTIDSSSSFSFVAISMSLIAIVGLRLVFLLIQTYFIRPWSAYKALVEQGFHVLPYPPVTGNLVELRRMDAEAQMSPMPSPSHHHLLFDRLCPFINKHISTSHHQDDAPFVFWWGTHATVVITKPEDAKCVMTADVKHLKRLEVVKKSFFRLLGNGLLLIDGEEWEHHRNIMRPAFFAEKLKEMVVHMTASTMEMVEDWMKQVIEQGSPLEIEVAKPIKDVTADILVRSLFGSSYLEGREVFEMQVELLELLSQLRVRNTIIPGYKYLPTQSNRKCANLEANMNLQLHEIVESRRKRIQSEGGVYGSDLLGLILEEETKGNTKGAKLTTQHVIDECKTFFFAGHETTAGLLAWTMVLLSLNQEWQDKARKEVLEICGKGEDLEPNSLSRLKIVGMVLNETLRLYPPVPEQGRRIMIPTEKDFKLGSRTLPPNTAFVIECLYIHRRKDIWGDDADEFKPERFSNGVANACKHPYGFLPFGIGPRICIGQHYAMMEAKVILALILKNFQFHISPNYKHAPLNTITLRPKHGVQVIIEPI